VVDTENAAQSSSRTGAYRVLAELGEGGTAVVYLAVSQGAGGFNKLVVLKALKTSMASDADFRRMFINEARLSARLSHPNIVVVNEIIEQDGVPVIVMEYLDGKSLAEMRIRLRERFDLQMQLRILSEALNGLHYSHDLTDYDGTSLNLVHRDMSPHNVFVTYDGRVKILDFGIAKLSGSLVETHTGVIKGKLRYMPPEQISGEKVDRRADIYAAGVMLWEAATGTRMWPELSEAAIMNRVLRGEVPSPRDVRPDVSPELERICMKALAPKAADRYATAADMQADVDTLLGQLSATVTGRDVGQYLSRHFEDSRKETQRLIEDQLKGSSLAQSRDSATFSSSGSIAEPTPSISHTLESSRDKAAARRKRVLIALGAVVVAATSVAFASKSSRPGPVAAVGPGVVVTPAAPVSSSSTAQLERITVRFMAFPLEAQLLLDGKPIEGNPYTTVIPADRTLHRVEAEAPGYVKHSAVAIYDRDVDVVLNLVPAAPTRQTGRRTSAARPRPGASATPTSTPAEQPRSACDPAYFVDARGIKKFKPGCY
jgi:serine/threonine-protein kinase